MIKKLIALLLALTMAFCLCACGEPEEIPGPTAEEMLAKAEDIDFTKLMDLPALAEKYIKDRYLKTTGYVSEIGEDYAEVIPLDTWLDSNREPLVRIHACLPKQELKELHEKQIINLVGMGTYFSQPIFGMETARLAGDDLEFDGTVGSIFPEPGGKIMLAVSNEGGIVGSYPTSFWLRYYFDSNKEYEEKGTLTVGDTTIAVGDNLHIVCKADFDVQEYSEIPGEITICYFYELKDFESVEKR